ncbi:unnamed protein product [Arabidopsis halleri]
MKFNHRDHNPDSFQRFIQRDLLQHEGDLTQLHLIIDSRTSTMDLAGWIGLHIVRVYSGSSSKAWWDSVYCYYLRPYSRIDT